MAKGTGVGSINPNHPWDGCYFTTGCIQNPSKVTTIPNPQPRHQMTPHVLGLCKAAQKLSLRCPTATKGPVCWEKLGALSSSLDFLST